jgi:hypothetical protein
MRQVAAARHRTENAKARHDMREWVVERRARTRRLIELGGLVQKAGLIELTRDNRAVLFGALLDIAGQLRGEQAEHLAALWRRRGRRAFEADAMEDR